MKILFDQHYQKKVMIQSFEEKTVIDSLEVVQSWRSQWMSALSSWHSPYKLLIDCENLWVAKDNPAIVAAVEKMFKFFKGFFLIKSVGFNESLEQGHAGLPVEFFSREQAYEKLRLGELVLDAKPGDFRSQIQLMNHFRQQTMELSFKAPVLLGSPDELEILRSKMVNNLNQWHSHWNLLIDCTALEFSPVLNEAFAHFERFFRGVFMRSVVGYSPQSPGAVYPFKVYRSRHKAVASLAVEAHLAADEANCQSRK